MVTVSCGTGAGLPVPPSYLVEVRKPLLADEGHSALILIDLHFKMKVGGHTGSSKGKPCHMTSALWHVIVFHVHVEPAGARSSTSCLHTAAAAACRRLPPPAATHQLLHNTSLPRGHDKEARIGFMASGVGETSQHIGQQEQ